MKARSKQSSVKKVARSANQRPHTLDEPFPFAERCSESKRAPGVHQTEPEHFEIITLPNGKKIAALRAGLGWGNNATATFIYDKGEHVEVSLLSPKKIEHFKQVLESRIAEFERVLANAEQETRASFARLADSADQAAAEYERQTLAHKADLARQTIRGLKDAVKRITQGSFGECAQCGAEIESKRLEAIPWARYCVKCQEAREQR
jgi:DnaK suppressor protein